VNQEDEVFSVGDISILQARFFISNRDIRDVVAGRDVIILAERESPVRTKIDFVSPVLDQETRTATAFAEIQNSNIRPGIFITGAVVQGRKTAKLSLPIAYCGAEGSKQIGILIRDGEKTSLRKVEIGARDYFNCEVLSGIDVGEVVVDVEVGSAKS
jgi:multidrug efflux pump subunit AcrA (membrane-fusion protein)